MQQRGPQRLHLQIHLAQLVLLAGVGHRLITFETGRWVVAQHTHIALRLLDGAHHRRISRQHERGSHWPSFGVVAHWSTGSRRSGRLSRARGVWLWVSCTTSVLLIASWLERASDAVSGR